MLLWRISRHRDLSGSGGLRASGRWHDRGLPVVYLAETPAGALLEACVHTSANDVPPTYPLLAVRVHEQVSIKRLEMTALQPNWIDRLEATREVGSAWLHSLRSALLRVPSALVPATLNVLLNPLHPQAAYIQIESIYEYPFDPRLKK
jgi:RES domain-containing protein